MNTDMNSNLVIHETVMHPNPVTDTLTLQLNLADLSQARAFRTPVYITLDKTRSAELFAAELRDAANDIDRWVRRMSGGEK